MCTTRRGFLRSVLGATFTGATVLDQAIFRATLARAQANYELPELFDIEKVTDGIYAALARPRTVINCNAVIFENASDLLILDSHSKPSSVAALVRQLRRHVSDKAVRYVVASHFHWDHSQGLPAYRRIVPRADIIASETTRRLIDAETLPRLKESFIQLGAQAEDYKKRAGSATNPKDQSAYRQMAREIDDYIREMKEFQPELPNLTLDRDLILHDKGHDLHIAFRGRGHTSGDVVVYCPQKKTIATGDLLHGAFPFLADAYPLDWPRTLASVGQFELSNIIGGHGGVFRSRDRLGQMSGYIEEVTAAVAEGKRAGKSQSQLEAEITPGKLKTIQAGFGEASARAALGFRTLPPPAPSLPNFVADSVKVNVGHIHTALDRKS